MERPNSTIFSLCIITYLFFYLLIFPILGGGGRVNYWPIVPTPDDDECGEIGGMLGREETCPSAAMSTTNPTWPDPGSNQAAAVGSQRLTAWATARSNILTYLLVYLLPLYCNLDVIETVSLAQIPHWTRWITFISLQITSVDLGSVLILISHFRPNLKWLLPFRFSKKVHHILRVPNIYYKIYSCSSLSRNSLHSFLGGNCSCKVR
jgi:hypothetical protein